MGIRQEFRLNVDIPEAVWLEFGHTQEFEIAWLTAVEGSLDAGQCFYDAPYTWAVFSTREAATAAQHKLMDLNYKFAAKLLPNEEQA